MIEAWDDEYDEIECILSYGVWSPISDESGDGPSGEDNEIIDGCRSTSSSVFDDRTCGLFSLHYVYEWYIWLHY